MARWSIDFINTYIESNVNIASPMARWNVNDDMPRRNDDAGITSLTQSIPDSTLQVYGGDMTVVGGEWSTIEGDDDMEYLKAVSGVNLEVTGSIPMYRLQIGKNYQGVFEVSLTRNVSGFSNTKLVTVEVCIPNGSTSRKTYDVMKKSSLSTSFRTPSTLSGYLTFKLHQKTPNVDKKGLIIKRFLLWPLNKTMLNFP